jgi:cytochrome d ubiquinol oxidase subunit II
MALNRVSIWIILLTLAAPVPIITALLAASEWYSLSHRHELTPLLGAFGLFLMSFIGIAISLWRMVVPFHYTL